MDILDLFTLSASLVLAWVTSKLTYRHENKKFLLEKREVLYCELIELLDKLKNDPFLMFADELRDSLLKSKPRMKLLASDSVLRDYIVMFQFIARQYESCKQFCNANDPTVTMVEYIVNGDGDEECVGQFTENDMEYFEWSLSNEKKRIINDGKSELDDDLDRLINSMRSDICNHGIVKWRK